MITAILTKRAAFALTLGIGLVTSLPALALELLETPSLQSQVDSGELPPVTQRVPTNPRIVQGEEVGQHGGDLRVIMGRARDIRMMVVYGYSRLVAYNEKLEFVPDIAEDFQVEDGHTFTFTLREGHKWSDGEPLTAEDFRYWWEDVALNEELSPFGPPPFLKVDGELPRFEIVDGRTFRYSWSRPNPFLLARLAAPRPPFIYRPSHFMKRFHIDYADAESLNQLTRDRRARNWAAVHNAMDNMYNNDNPELPTLQPWINTVKPPSQLFVFERNPFFHRVDPEGRQLPYIDRVLMSIADSKLIPAKAGAGETDLQARSLFMSHYTFLRQSEDREGYMTHLWRTGKGARIALFPNLNHGDPVWRDLFRDARFRRALSLAIDRDEINQVIYFGLATPANNTVLPESPLFREEYQTKWTEFDPRQAEALLDDLGLSERNNEGVRLLPDGRPLEIVIETAGEETEQVDVLELIHDTWLDVGIKIFTRPSQREVFRNRIFAGETQIAVWEGVDNGIPTPRMSPGEFAPTEQNQYQWPKWGQHFETSGQAGEPPDMAVGEELFQLFNAWQRAETDEERAEIWHRMLEIHADEVFSIGVVCCTRQPVVVSNRLRNVPDEGMYAWDPGAYFGVYLPDTFFLAEAGN
ncbi:MAG: ABC transporter substrate-binding protein [Alphaproteobacteria bacterium]